jgi:hypothetical protein
VAAVVRDTLKHSRLVAEPFRGGSAGEGEEGAEGAEGSDNRILLDGATTKECLLAGVEPGRGGGGEEDEDEDDEGEEDWDWWESQDRGQSEAIGSSAGEDDDGGELHQRSETRVRLLA